MSSYNYIVPTGVIVPDTSETQTEVQNEYKAAFGADLVVTANTPQGVLITAETLARNNTKQLNATLANQINPNLAGGQALVAIGALTGSKPDAPTYSTVVGNMTGVPGTVIPSGAQVRDRVYGNVYVLQSAVTLDGGGLGSGTFQAVTGGPQVVGVGTLTQIVTTTVPGWETVNNTDPAILGSFAQSDAAFRNRRRATLASQGRSIAEAITSALNNTPGVKSNKFRENDKPTTEVIDGVTMVGHSIYACVDGGLDADVANAMVSKKDAGASYNGGVTVPTLIPFSGQTIDVKFDRPTLINVLVRITVSFSSEVADITTAVTQAILDYANGLLSDEPGLTVGTPVSAFEIGGAVNREYPILFVKNVELSLALPISYSCATIPIEIFQKAVLTESAIQVIIA